MTLSGSACEDQFALICVNTVVKIRQRSSELKTPFLFVFFSLKYSLFRERSRDRVVKALTGQSVGKRHCRKNKDKRAISIANTSKFLVVWCNSGKADGKGAGSAKNVSSVVRV